MSKKQSVWVIGHKITPLETSGKYDLFVGETPVGVPGPPPHYHTNYAELFMVLEGKMEFVSNGKTVVLNEGESIDLPPGTPHTFANPTDKPIKWLNIHSPKGFSAFFKTFGVPADEQGAFEASISKTMIDEVVKRASSFDMKVVHEDAPLENKEVAAMAEC